MKKILLVLLSLVLVIGLQLSFIAVPASASIFHPTYLPADVDGDYGEWNLVGSSIPDAHLTMYRAFNSNKPQEATVYFRYNGGVMYVLVLVKDGIKAIVDDPLGSNAWGKDNETNNGQVVNKLYDSASGDDGVAPDFKWIGLSDSGTRAQGYEASFPIEQGTYTMSIHVQVYDDNKSQTAGTGDFEIIIFLPAGQLPELPAGALLAMGLAGIGGIVWFTRRSRAAAIK